MAEVVDAGSLQSRLKNFLENAPDFVNIVRDVFLDTKLRYLNASILIYAALLPFNVFGFTIPVLGKFIKYTEVALVFIVIFGVIAYLKKHIKIREANWLYLFLILNIGAQFLSIVFAPYPFNYIAPAIAAAQYSVLVFVLIQVFHSEKLIKAVLVVMGLSVLIVVFHSLILYVIQDGVFQTREQPSIIGNDIGNYLSYLLVMFGAGLAYIFLNERWGKWWVISAIVLAGWMYSVIITGVKMGQLTTLAMFSILFVILKGSRFRVLIAMAILFGLFGVQYNIVPIQNQVTDTKLAFNQKTQQVKLAIDNTRDSILGNATARLALLTDKGPKEAGLALVSEGNIVEDGKLVEGEAEVEGSVEGEAGAGESSEGEESVTGGDTGEGDAGIGDVVEGEIEIGELTENNEDVVEVAILDDEDAPEEIVEPLEPEPEPVKIAKEGKENFVQKRWVNDSASSLELRVRGILAAFSMGLDHPLFGVGAGQQMFFFDHYSELIREKSYAYPERFTFLPHTIRKPIVSTNRLTISQSNPNNILLMAWAETGIFGLVALLGILWMTFYEATKSLWRMRFKRGLFTFRILIASFLTLMMFQLVNPFILHPWLWTTLALLYASSQLSLNKNTRIAVG
jgi:hypothetical protein